MERLRMTSPDLTRTNIDKIADIFPAVVTETLGADGEPMRAVDFDLLRQELSDYVVDGPQERYQLDWPGKRAAAFAANAPIAKTLRPRREDSVDFDTSKNLFIEGDNLDALKLLQESYLGKVKLIYIDPPYNTGNDLLYEDDRSESSANYLERSGQADIDAARLVANPDSSGRYHSNWLSLMYPRLKLARNLLSDDGVMFISIDENEVANLVRLCEEVFGRTADGSNVLGALPVVMNLKGNQDAFGFAETHEFVVVCLRNRSAADIGKFPVDEDEILAQWDSDEHGLFKRADTLRRTGDDAPRTRRPNGWFPVFIDSDRAVYVTADDLPRVSGDTVLWPINDDGEELSWSWQKSKIQAEPHNLVVVDGRSGPNIYKKQRPELGDLPSKKPKSFLFKPSYSTSTATTQLKQLLGGKFFSGPKPVPFLEDLVHLGSHKDSLVLDFFAGSGSLAQAVIGLNASDGGQRRFIAVQLDEETPSDSAAFAAGFHTISQLARARIKKAGEMILGQVTHEQWDRDGGFRALRIDSTNLVDVRRAPESTTQEMLGLLRQSIKSDRNGEDLLFQVLLDWGVELSLPIARERIQGIEVFAVDDDAVIACFAEAVTDAVMREIAERRPLRAVFLDSGFATDAARINAEQIFREVSPETEVRAI